jgi:1,4-alpha-glucan branching enzyme
MWFRDYHMDALRLDAIHAIYDFGASHILADVKAGSIGAGADPWLSPAT